MAFFGGVEGGATNTTVVILESSGRLLAKVHGSGSNGWLLGAGKVADLLIDLFTKAKTEAGLPQSTKLDAMGLCMSGFLQPRIQEELREAFRERSPELCSHYYIDNDSPGSVFTAAGAAGGLVIICGTGTMAQLINADGKAFNCGGWGHMFGDEASACYIATTTIKRIFYALDGYSALSTEPIPDVSAAFAAMQAYFNISDRDGMLDVFYKDYNKGRVAGFTRVLADAARNGDAFCLSAFADAGRHLGSMARTLAPRLLPAVDDDAAADAAAVGSGAAPEGRNVSDLAVVCVGSVWKSFDLMRDAFVDEATAPFVAAGKCCVYSKPTTASSEVESGKHAPGGRISSFKLVRLTETSAVGAAWKGARDVGSSIPIDHTKLTEVVYSWP